MKHVGITGTNAKGIIRFRGWKKFMILKCKSKIIPFVHGVQKASLKRI